MKVWRLVATYAAVVGGLILVDQVSKALAFLLLPDFYGEGFLSLGVILHYGPEGGCAAKLAVGLLFLAYAWSTTLPRTILYLWTAGGLSNMLEYACFGSVVDFIGVESTPGAFVIFNVADVFIVLGFAMLFWYALSDRLGATAFLPGGAFLKKT